MSAARPPSADRLRAMGATGPAWAEGDEVVGPRGRLDKEIQIFNTILATADNRRVIIPNGQLSTSSLINYSVHETRRLEVTLGIGYDDDIEQARGVIKGLIDSDPRSLQDPEPVIKVGNLGDSSVDMLIRVWVERADFWAYRVDFLEKAKIAFDAQNISIPYPQSEVTMRSESA